MNVKDVIVEIRTARERFPAFDAKLFDRDGFFEIRGEFDITYDGEKLCITHGEPLEYHLTFAEGISRTAHIQTPYGAAEMSYTVSKMSYKKADGRHVFKIAYKQQGNDGCELYTITATEKQGVRK